MQGGTGQRGGAACSRAAGEEPRFSSMWGGCLGRAWPGPTGHSERAQHSVGAALTVPCGQEVAVGTEGQRADADLGVCSVGSGLQRLQGHRPRGDLI